MIPNMDRWECQLVVGELGFEVDIHKLKGLFLGYRWRDRIGFEPETFPMKRKIGLSLTSKIPYMLRLYMLLVANLMKWHFVYGVNLA